MSSSRGGYRGVIKVLSGVWLESNLEGSLSSWFYANLGEGGQARACAAYVPSSKDQAKCSFNYFFVWLLCPDLD